MGWLTSLSFAKKALLGIVAIFVLILMIPLLILLSQERQTLHGQIAEAEPTIQPISLFSGKTVIAGYVYHDNNKDGQREEEEKSFPDVLVQMKELKDTHEDGQILSEVKTDSYGYFSFRVNVNKTSSYMVKVFLPKHYSSVNTNPIILADLKPNVQKIVEFGLVPDEGMPTPTPTHKPVPKATATPTSAQTEVTPTP
jgi:hypothetical protein